MDDAPVWHGDPVRHGGPAGLDSSLLSRFAAGAVRWLAHEAPQGRFTDA